MTPQQTKRGIVVHATSAADRRLIDELLGGSALREEDFAPGATIVCHRASSASPCPDLSVAGEAGRVVVLSDCTTEPIVVATLEAGAHHYLDIGEPRGVLAARLLAALRSNRAPTLRELRVPPFHFDLVRRRARRDGRAADLSPKEFDLAYYLFANRGRTVDKRELMTAVWSLPRTMDTRRIDTAACRIRKKLCLEERGGWRLRRCRRVGYRLLGPGEER